MGPDDEVCLCFHVRKRKVLSFLRVEKPKRVSQLSACQGAGTGCGWCRPFLQQLFEQYREGSTPSDRSRVPDLPEVEEYAQQRAQYIREGKGTPPEGET